MEKIILNIAECVKEIEKITDELNALEDVWGVSLPNNEKRVIKLRARMRAFDDILSVARFRK